MNLEAERNILGNSMIQGTSLSSRMLDIVIHISLIILVICCLYPVLHVASVSLNSPVEVAKNNVTFYPRGFQLDAYELVLKTGIIPRSFKNSILYTSLGTAVNLIMTVLMAYPLSKKRLTLRGFLRVRDWRGIQSTLCAREHSKRLLGLRLIPQSSFVGSLKQDSPLFAHQFFFHSLPWNYKFDYHQKETLTVIDDRDPKKDPELVQFSNFNLFEHSETGQIELYTTRYGETSGSIWTANAYNVQKERKGQHV